MFTLIDNVEEVEVLKGSLFECLEHVRRYEQQYNEDREEKSLYLNNDGTLIKTDEAISDMVSDCEFTILETRTYLPINYIGIAEELN